jgi:hypothetical protein
MSKVDQVGFILFPSTVEKLWTIKQFFTENSFKLKRKLQANLGVLLILLENRSWIKFNEGELELFRPKVQEIFNFDYFFSLKI